MKHSVIVGYEHASEIVSMLLVNSWIVGIEYWRTAWSITLAVEEDHQASKAGILTHPFEFVISATEIIVAEPKGWSECIAAAPVNIAAYSDRQDSLAALLLFNSVAYRLTEARINAGGDLLVSFEGNRQLIVHGHVQSAEDEWSIANKWRDQEKEPVFVGADAGKLYLFPQAAFTRHTVP